jgi:predicted HTH transcriptional regulator
MNLFEATEFSIADIDYLINYGQEESLRLEFKASEALGEQDSKKKEIAKDISAFANSAGGIIIYGIEEKDHKAYSKSFINGRKFTKEWIEQVINLNIARRIEGIQIYPIRNNGNIEETIYLIRIPESNNGPHMSPDDRFYRRYNFQILRMEEFEIRRAYITAPYQKADFFGLESSFSQCTFV